MALARKWSVAVAGALLLLSGCSTMSGTEKWCVGASVADTVTTYAALKDGAREANPIMSVAGSDAATVAATSAAISYGYIRLIHWMRESGKMTKEQSDTPFLICSSLRSVAAINNLKIVLEGD